MRIITALDIVKEASKAFIEFVAGIGAHPASTIWLSKVGPSRSVKFSALFD
jgi:hypothetical protein